ncbi:MAG: hypothetical protein WCS20_09315 [Alphaproteobacteria bacterium]
MPPETPKLQIAPTAQLNTSFSIACLHPGKVNRIPTDAAVNNRRFALPEPGDDHSLRSRIHMPMMVHGKIIGNDLNRRKSHATATAQPPPTPRLHLSFWHKFPTKGVGGRMKSRWLCPQRLTTQDFAPPCP